MATVMVKRRARRRYRTAPCIELRRLTQTAVPLLFEQCDTSNVDIPTISTAKK